MSETETRRRDFDNVLPKKTIRRYALGSIGTGGYNTLPGLVLVFYLTDTLGVAAIWAGIIVTVAKIWDVIIDPFIGAMSDLIMERFGSRRSLMLVGAIALPALFVLTFSVAPGLPPIFSAIWVLIAFSLAAIGFSLYQVPYIALPAELTQGYDDRTRLLTWRVVVLTIGILVFGGGGPEIRDFVTKQTGNPNFGYLIMAAVLALVILFAMLGSLKAVPSRPKNFQIKTFTNSLPKQTVLDGSKSYIESIRLIRRAKPFRALWIAFSVQALAIGLLLAVVQYVATWVLETGVTLLFVSLIGPALILTPVWRQLADRVGKERTFVWATLMFATATASTVFLLWSPGVWVYISVFFAGTAFAGVQALGLAMLPDTITDDIQQTGEDRAGLLSGVWTAGETTGLAFGATILAIILTVTGYVETVGLATVQQPEMAVSGIIIGMSVIPAALLLLSLVFFRAYKLNKSRIETR